MTHYRRARVPGGTYFFTVALADRSQTLLVDHVNALRRAMRDVRAAHPFEVDAIVVLPDHLHTIWTLPLDDDDYSVRWALLKASFSRTLPRDETRSKSRRCKRERGIWQRRFWEHVIRDEADLLSHIDYIHNNPVKHGYVEDALTWPYSSARRMSSPL